MNKILVIEDEFPTLETISDILVANGYEVITASNGNSGVELAGSIKPEVILCDIYMPDISGYEVLKKIRNNPVTQSIPFIFLTGRSGSKDLRKGMLLGADDYITKPFTINELVDTVRTQLEKHSKKTKHFENEIIKSKYYDEFSGLGNRALLEKHLEDAVKNENGANSFALYIIKIDRFEDTRHLLNKNDFESVQLKIVTMIKNILTEFDQLYVLHNGKFAILMQNKDKSNIALMADEILKSIRQPLVINSHTLHLTTSIGITFSTSAKHDPVTLISNAELALKHAVEKGQNNFQYYKPKLKKMMTDEIILENDLFNALKKDELEIHYQPKMNLQNNVMAGMEALLRWNNPKYGFISPAKFIPIAEANGLIIPIGEWLIRKTLADFAYLKNTAGQQTSVAINISVRQLKEKNFINTIRKVLDKTGFNNLDLELELTESIFADDVLEISKILKSLKSSGVSLSLDDFGTGYSSLSYINKFPFDKIKIDQAFIRDVPFEENARKLVTGIISMAKDLGFTVIAEGVEKAEQVEFLRQNNCDEIQGYFYSKPVPAHRISQIM